MGDLSNFLISSLIFFFKDLKFYLNRAFTSLVSVMPRYFMLFLALINDDIKPGGGGARL